MDIVETDEYYVVSFFPGASEVEIDDKPEKGYKAIIGEQSGEHVVMKVMYAKSMYDLDTAIKLAKNIKDCPICKKLNAQVADIGRIQLQDQYTTRQVQATPVAPEQNENTPKSSGSELFNTGNPLQDVLTRMMFDTNLNTAGQVATALAFSDEGLLGKVMPKTIDGVVSLMADLTELSQGKGDMYRSPQEVTDYVKALRQGVETPVDEKTEEKKETPVFRRASTIIVS